MNSHPRPAPGRIRPNSSREALASIAISLGYFFLFVGALLFLLGLTGAGKIAGLWIASTIGGAGLLLGGKGIRSNSRGLILALLTGNGALICLGLFYVAANGGPEWTMRKEPYVAWPLLGLIALEIVASPLAFPDPIKSAERPGNGDINSTSN